MQPSLSIRIVVLALVPACGWVQEQLGGESGENRRACEAYVAHMNTLQTCMNITYDADNLCSGVDGAPVDMAPYYDCLRSNSSCQGTEPVLSLDACTPPVVSIGG